MWRALTAWFDSPLGQELRATEGKHLDAVLSNLFGYHLLQVGRLGQGDMLGTSRVSHAVVMDPATGCGTPEDDERRLLGLPHGLPIASASLDVVVLPHVLEFSDTPHDVLREVERTLIPEGHIVLLGFNPWSMWYLARLLFGWRGRVPWCGRFLSLTRVKDWLRLLGFDIVEVRSFFFRPPLRHPGAMRRLRFLERFGARLWPVFGGGYLLLARKRVATLTPLRPRWQPRRRRLVGGLAEPSQTRNMRRIRRGSAVEHGGG
ncbi:MAG: methyltransferase domain-containing protein [Pseudomonadota bacterium]|nr:MAG: methyltransferase domain-containing protein [Pseudomonadota bacterium]